MKLVKADEVLGLGAYESVRDRFRARIIAHKKTRRVLLGPEMSLVFEDHDTVLALIQEMLRAERISDPDAIQTEIDTYNELVPPDGSLLATLMIEIVNEAERERKRRAYVGLDGTMALELGDRRVPARFAPEGLWPDRIAVVQYLSFDLDAEAHRRLGDASASARIVCEHPSYRHAVEIPAATRASLAHDLDPRLARFAAS